MDNMQELRTARLQLKRLLSNEKGTEDLEWFHKVWSNDQATQWSYHGPCKTRQESRAWLAGVIPDASRKKTRIAYAVLHTSPEIAGQQTSERQQKKVGSDADVAGIVTLLSVKPEDSDQHETGRSPATTVEIGYLFLPHSWGHGYATESLTELLRAYRADSTNVNVEANAHLHNGKSRRVLEKLGFREVERYEQDGTLQLVGIHSTDTIVRFQMSM